MAIKAPPGTYTVSTIHFVNRMGGLIHHKNIEKPTGKLPISAPFKVDPGKIYYLGDFVGETSVKIEGGYIHQAWRIKDYTYKPKQTAEIFVTEHPEFKNIVIEEPFRASVPK